MRFTFIAIIDCFTADRISPPLLEYNVMCLAVITTKSFISLLCSLEKEGAFTWLSVYRIDHGCFDKRNPKMHSLPQGQLMQP